MNRQAVYDFLTTIPRGKVVTYGQIAEFLGSRRLARAVGSVLHQNPDGEKYPCCKVVDSRGRLSAQYAFGGLAEQKRRLEADGVPVENGRVDLRKYQYQPIGGTVMLEEKQFESVKYLVSYPKDFDPAGKHPLVIYLHGAGTRSADTEILRSRPNLLKLQQRQSRGYVLLAPLCSVNNWNEIMSSLIGLVGRMREEAYIDPTRVHLTGNSMGGYGTWELAALRPDWFASIMPLCGGGVPWMAGNLADVPVRAFHGLKDATVDPGESLKMAIAVNKKGGHAELILFPDLSHNCWERVYSTEENYDWLLSFTTKRDKSEQETLTGTQYG